MAPPEHVVRKVYAHPYVRSSPPHQGRVLRGKKQKPDIREQSNLVAKEQSACKEEESIYRRSPAGLEGPIVAVSRRLGDEINPWTPNGDLRPFLVNRDLMVERLLRSKCRHSAPAI